jgi:hypothetical protein
MVSPQGLMSWNWVGNKKLFNQVASSFFVSSYFYIVFAQVLKIWRKSLMRVLTPPRTIGSHFHDFRWKLKHASRNRFLWSNRKILMFLSHRFSTVFAISKPNKATCSRSFKPTKVSNEWNDPGSFTEIKSINFFNQKLSKIWWSYQFSWAKLYLDCFSRPQECPKKFFPENI